MGRQRGSRRVAMLVAAVLLGAMASGCGVADQIEDARSDLEEQAEAGGGSASPSDDGPGEEGGDLSNDIALGWRVTGPIGSMATVEDSLSLESSERPFENTVTVEIDDDEPKEFLYTAWVLEADVTVTVDAGGPVRLELMRGYLNESNEPGVLPEIVFTETLESVEVTAGTPVTVSGPRLDP